MLEIAGPAMTGATASGAATATSARDSTRDSAVRPFRRGGTDGVAGGAPERDS
ncbi:hypothetical protein [Streptomyces sp. NPDC057686]|uniref:hypothetical protein n=1 Tax=Streptomyces sp. NPDC057686 TaxID=3346212 RepID=UPI0036997554